MPRDYYQILGVPREGTEIEIRTAYREKAVNVSPNESDAGDPFMLLQEAYDTLSDPVRRRKYDGTLPKMEKSLPRVVFSPPPPFPNPPIFPVAYMLEDGEVYTFETASSVLRAPISNGDFIRYDGVEGRFIGLAGDHCWWWRKETAEFPSKLCNPQSSMAMSKITVVQRLRRPGTMMKVPERPVRELLGIQKGSSAPLQPMSTIWKKTIGKEKEEKLKAMKEKIIEEGRQRVQATTIKQILAEESELRENREKDLLALHLASLLRYSNEHQNIQDGRGPTMEEWDFMTQEAGTPLSPYYPGERKRLPAVSTSFPSSSMISDSSRDTKEATERVEKMVSLANIYKDPCTPNKGASSNKNKKNKKVEGTYGGAEKVKKASNDTKETKSDTKKKKTNKTK